MASNNNSKVLVVQQDPQVLVSQTLGMLLVLFTLVKNILQSTTSGVASSNSSTSLGIGL